MFGIRLYAGQVASTISMISRVSRGCWEGPKCQARRSAAVSSVSPTSTSPDDTVAHTVLCQMCSRERGPAVRRLRTNLRTCCSLALPSCKRCLRVAFSKLPYESITPKYLNDVTLGKPSWDFACPSPHLLTLSVGRGAPISNQHGKRGKMKLLDTKTGLEGQGSKVSSEQHGKRGKRGKMKLLDTKTGLEIGARKSTTWKGWKRTFCSLWGGCSSSPLCGSYRPRFKT